MDIKKLDERCLADRIRLGREEGVVDKEAEGEMAERHIALAIFLANKRTRSRLELRDDVSGEAVLAIVMAMLSFDPNQGVKFSTYAAKAINHRISDFLKQFSGPIRLPTYLQKKKYRMSERKWKRHEKAARKSLSLSAEETMMAAESERHEEGGVSEAVEHKEECEALAEGLGGLTDKERRVLGLRFGDESLSRREVGRRLGLNKVTVRLIERRSLKMLQRAFKLIGTSD